MLNRYLEKIFLLVILLTIPILKNYASIEPDSLSITDNDIVKIDSIKVMGNDVTKEFIILRELTFQQGDSVSGKQLRFNKERVVSLGLFSRVDLHVIPNEGKNICIVSVYESWYIYPIPIVRFRDSDIKKANYGINLLYKNFRGRNETIRTVLSFGYDPSYSILYSNPALNYESKIGLYIGTTYVKTMNRSEEAKSITGEDFSYKMFVNSISMEKRINQFNDLLFTAGFNYIESERFGLGKITASGRKIDRVPVASISYYYDSRDLKQYSLYGLYTSVSISQKGFGWDNINYSVVDLDFREYRKIINHLTGRWRLTYRGTFGETVPYYDYSFFGYGYYVRGHSSEYREGNHSLLTSFELIYPLMTEWNFSIKLPLIPEKLTSARIGIYMTSFIDYGGTFYNKDKFSLNEFYSGYGVGLTILAIPYNAVRIEYAFANSGKGELLFGLGFSF
jgi:outer membrane protein assembly factor BamA